jgi:hypothetical protein
MPCHAMHPMQDLFFWNVFHKYYNFIYTPICTKFLFLQKVGVTLFSEIGVPIANGEDTSGGRTFLGQTLTFGWEEQLGLEEIMALQGTTEGEGFLVESLQ